MILLLGAALMACVLGLAIGIFMIAAAASIWWPAVLFPVGCVLYVLWPLRKLLRRSQGKPVHHSTRAPYVRRSRPPMPSSMDDPRWL